MNNENMSEMFSEEEGESGGFLEVVYREIFSNQAEIMVNLQNNNVTDSHTLLRTFSDFPEAEFTHYLTAEAPVLRKSKERSNQMREKGNRQYAAGNNMDAIECYTSAIRFAPYRILEDQFSLGAGEELALAYANRSAVLVKLKEYGAALRDIQLAFTAHYPKELQYKLHERQAQCQLARKEKKLTQEAFSLCLAAISDSKLEGEKKESFADKIRSQIGNLKIDEKLKTDRKTEKTADPDCQTKPRLKEKNVNFPAFSSAVEIKYEKERGRFGVCTRDIPLGELVCCEAPPCFYLHEETTGLNCSHCFRKSVAPLPSPLCTQNVFCSDECQKAGMLSYHVVESKFMDVLFQNGLKKKEWFLALRAVTQRPLEFFNSIKNSLEHDPLKGVHSSTGNVYETDDFLSLYNLVSHHDEWDFKEHAYKAFFALFFIRCLQKSKYFGPYQSTHRGLGDEELMIGKILIHLMEVATMNSHEIGQLECEDGKSWLLGSTKPVGCALEPTMVLLNHSCDPALIRVNRGTSTYCFASRNIKKGEEITDGYTYSYDALPKTNRLPELQRKYKFSCVCEACRQDWQTFHLLPKSFNDIDDSQLKLGPQDLQQLPKLMRDIQQLGSTIHKQQQLQDYTAAMAVYPDFLRTLERVIRPPHQFYVIARRSYSTCLWVKYGNLVKLPSK